MSDAGRPKSIMDLTEDQLKHIVSLYDQGASDVEVKAYIWKQRGSFSNDLWERWLKEEPIFSETVKMGRVFSQQWWELNGRTGLRDKEFNYTGWYMNMKNRFGWKDKQDITSNDESVGIAFAGFAVPESDGNGAQ